MKKISSIVLLFVLTACVTTPPSPEAPVPSGAVSLDAKLMAWDGKVSAAPLWNVLLQDQITNEGLQRTSDLQDAVEFCPRYSELGENLRLQFWASLISWMARFESGFDPAETYTESFPDAQGNRVVSRGLLQLSIESANQSRYGCAVNKAVDLHEVRTNLACGTRILSVWVHNDGYAGKTLKSGQKGGARYWSVLRDSSASRAKIISGLHVLKFCW